MIIATIIAVLICAFTYRLGGLSKEQAKKDLPWVPSWLVASWVRDLSCTLTAIAWVYYFLPQVELWRYGASGILMYGAMTTYWDWWPPNKSNDNYFMHGLFIGLAMAPISYELAMWVELVARSFILGFLMRFWCTIFSNDYVEECGRGGFIALTLPLLLPDFILSNISL